MIGKILADPPASGSGSSEATSYENPQNCTAYDEVTKLSDLGCKDRCDGFSGTALS
ncbi:MAG: hypothetical protein JW717_05220 [Marinilabiliaceae bacterium]|nr:hypothetical protein [Marinilabiliaceae bacterium]